MKSFGDSRPKCPACFGSGTMIHPFTDEEVECAYCYGQKHDPYYTGKEENDDDTRRSS